MRYMIGYPHHRTGEQSGKHNQPGLRDTPTPPSLEKSPPLCTFTSTSLLVLTWETPFSVCRLPCIQRLRNLELSKYNLWNMLLIIVYRFYLIFHFIFSILYYRWYFNLQNRAHSFFFFPQFIFKFYHKNYKARLFFTPVIIVFFYFWSYYYIPFLPTRHNIDFLNRIPDTNTYKIRKKILNYI